MNANALGILALGGIMMFGALVAPTAARAMPVAALEPSAAALGALTDVRHRGRPHRAARDQRQRIVVHPGGYAYPDYNATYRGFQDPGFAVRGNMPGCATDLGYGRWESCDK